MTTFGPHARITPADYARQIQSCETLYKLCELGKQIAREKYDGPILDRLRKIWTARRRAITAPEWERHPSDSRPVRHVDYSIHFDKDEAENQ